MRIPWHEIDGMKKMGIFSPGIRVYNHDGEYIEVSSTLGQYDVIVDIIRRSRKDLGAKPMIVDDQGELQQNLIGATDLMFTAPGWRWAAIPVVFIICLILFLGAMSVNINMFITLFFGLLFLTGVPIYIHGFMKEPVLISTRGDQLTIRFRSETLRRTMKTNVENVKDICFNHNRIHSEYGTHPSTDLTVYFKDGSKVVAKNFESSDEEMYIRLCAWMEKYTDIPSQQKNK